MMVQLQSNFFRLAPKSFPSSNAARMYRYVPLLDEYGRDVRFDTTPDYIKKTIKDLYRRHVPISPNKNAIAKRRHHLYPAQIIEKQAMF